MNRFRITGVALALAAAGLVAVPAAPAQASITGGVAFECSLNLPVFPAANGIGTCSGKAVVGLMTGLDVAGQPYAIGGTGAGTTFGATFDYGTTCTAGVPTLTSLVGTMRISGIPLVDRPGTATMVGDFTGTLAGAIMFLRTEKTVITYDKDGRVISVESTRDWGFGRASIATVADCSHPQPVTGTLTAADILPA